MMEVIFLEIGDFSESTCVSVTKTLKAAQSFKWYNNEGFVRASMLWGIGSLQIIFINHKEMPVLPLLDQWSVFKSQQNTGICVFFPDT